MKLASYVGQIRDKLGKVITAPQKNVVRNEGIEKKVPEHKDSMKKNLSYRKSPTLPIKS